MSGARPLEVGVAELLRHPGERREIRTGALLEGLEITSATVPAGAEVDLDLELEATGGAVMADGTVRAPFTGACRRCLEDVHGEVVAEVHEIFERHPTEGETYPLGEDRIDLEPLVRDAVLLALPLAPLCDEACPGPAPDTFPAATATEASAADADAAPPRDPRWSALDELRFDT